MLDHTDQVPPDAWYCATDSTWRGRLDKLVPYLQAEGVSDQHLFHAATIISEVGDNCFAHNATAWPDVPGCWFAWSHDPTTREVRCIVADRGRGILQSLQRVRADLQSDRDALHVALTEQVTGRAPENRGRGLKLVIRTLDSIPQRSFVLQSGSAAFVCTSSRQAVDVVEQINDSADRVRGTYCEFSFWYED